METWAFKCSATVVAVLVFLSCISAEQGPAYDTNDWIPITPKTQPQSRSLVVNDNVAESSEGSSEAVPPEGDKDPPPLPQRASSRVLNLDAPQAQKFFPDDEHRVYRKRRPQKHKTRGEDGYKFEMPAQLPKGSSYLQYTNQDLNPSVYEQPPPLNQHGIQRQPVYNSLTQLPPHSALGQSLSPRLVSQQAVTSQQVKPPQQQLLTPQHQLVPQQQSLVSQQPVSHQQQQPHILQQHLISQVGQDQSLSAQHRLPQRAKVPQQSREPQNEQVYLQQQQLPPINAPNTYQQYNLPFNNTFYESLNPDSINHELLSDGQNQQATVKTSGKGGKESVQLVYVPLENLKTNQQQKELKSEAELRQADLKDKFNTRLTNIEQDFVQQALQAQRLQDQITLGQPLYYKQHQQFLQPQQKPQQYEIIQQQHPQYRQPQENPIQLKPQQYEIVHQQQPQYAQPQENAILPQPQQLVQPQHSLVRQQQPQQYVAPQQHLVQSQHLVQPQQLFVTPQQQSVTPQQHFVQSEERLVQAQPVVQTQKSNLVQSQRHLLQKSTEQQQIPHAQASNVPPPTATSPGNSTSKKRKPHQPPLAVYLETNKNAELDDILDALKEAKTIAVQDSIQPESPQVFIGPSSLNPPDGYVKFLLPYLNALDGKREKHVEELPFFVAPLSFKAPPGFSKIPLPSPHVGSVVVNNKELSTRRPSSTPSYYGETGNNYVTVGSSYGTSQYSPNIQSYNSQNFYQTPNLETSHQLNFNLNDHTQKLKVPAMQNEDAQGPTTPLTGEITPTKPRHKERVRIKNYKHTSNTNTGEGERNTPKIKSNSNFEQTFTVKEYSKPLKSHLQDSYFKKGEEKFPSLISNGYNTPSKSYVNTPSSILSGITTDSHIFSFTPKPEKTEAEKVIDELHSHSHSHAPKKEEPQLKPLDLAIDNFDLHQINTQLDDKHRSKDQVHYSPEDGFTYHHRKPEKPDSAYSFNSDLHSFKPSTILRDVNVETTTQKSKARQPTTVSTGSKEHYTVLEDFSVTESSKYGSPYDKKATTSKYDTIGEGNSSPYDHFDYENTKDASKPEPFGDFRPSYEDQTHHDHKEPPNPYFEQAQEDIHQDYNRNHKQQHSQHSFPQPNLDDLSDTFVPNPYLKSFKPSKGAQSDDKGVHNHRQSTVSVSGEDHFRQDQPKDEKKEKEYDASLADQSVTSLLTPNLLLPSKKKQNQNTRNEFSNPYFDFSSVAADGPQIDTSLYDYVPTTNLEPQGFGPSANSQLYTPESEFHQPSTTAQTKPHVTEGEAPEVVYIHPTTTTTTTTTTEKPTTTTKPRTRGRQRGASRFTDSITTTRRSVSRRRPTTSTERGRYNSQEQGDLRTTTTKSRFRTRGRTSPSVVTERIATTENEIQHGLTSEAAYSSQQDANTPKSYMQFEHVIEDQRVITAPPSSQENAYLLEANAPSAPGLLNLQTIPSGPSVQSIQVEDANNAFQYENTASTTSKPVVNVQISHPVTEGERRITELYHQQQPAQSQNHFQRNKIEVTTKTAMRGRGRGRSRFTTTTPLPDIRQHTTTITTSTPSKPETQKPEQEEFYGFIRTPNFSQEQPVVAATVQPTPIYENSFDISQQKQYLPNVNEQPDQPIIEQSTIRFLGEIRPKYTTRTYEATTIIPTEIQTDTPKPRIRTRGRTTTSRRVTSNHKTRYDEPSQRITEQATKRPNTVRSRGRSHYKPPEHLQATTEALSEANYPTPYLQHLRGSTAEPTSFQLNLGDDEEVDQQPHPSLYRPMVIEVPQEWHEASYYTAEQEVDSDNQVKQLSQNTTELWPLALPIQGTSEQATPAGSDEIYKNNTEKVEEQFEELNTKKPNSRRRGVWKLVKQRPVDKIEPAESQNYYSVLNSFEEKEKVRDNEKGGVPPYGSYNNYNPAFEQNSDAYDYESKKLGDKSPQPEAESKIMQEQSEKSANQIDKGKQVSVENQSRVVMQQGEARAPEENGKAAAKNEEDEAVNKDKDEVVIQQEVQDYETYEQNEEVTTQELTTIARAETTTLQVTQVKPNKPSSLFDTLYEMFGITSNKPITTEKEDSQPTTTPYTPTFPEEITEEPSKNQTQTQPTIQTTTEEVAVTTTEASMTTTQSSTTVVRPYEVTPWEMKAVRTSTSTEVTHETEICYRGKCVKSNDKKN